MAINDTQKIDFLWKKLGFGATKTDVNSIKGATNEAIPSPLFLRGDKLWSDSSLIPGVIPSSTTSFVEVYSDANGNTTVETIEDITASPRRTWITGFENWIPPELGSTYQVKVYVDDPGADNPETTGTRLFAAGSGNNDEWFFDYQSGVLNFIGSNLPSPITVGKKIFVSGARYNGRFGTNSQEATFGNIKISGNTIESIDTDGNIFITPNGDGFVDISSPVNLTAINVDGAPVLIGTTESTGSEKLQVQGSASVTELMTADRFEGSIDGGEF